MDVSVAIDVAIANVPSVTAKHGCFSRVFLVFPIVEGSLAMRDPLGTIRSAQEARSWQKNLLWQIAIKRKRGPETIQNAVLNPAVLNSHAKRKAAKKIFCGNTTNISHWYLHN
jgi:hypothetical protein